MVKNYVVTIRLDAVEMEMLEQLRKELGGIAKSEVFRRLLWNIRILFDPDLPAREALMNYTGSDEPSLSDLLRPFPELIAIILRHRSRRKA